MIVVCSRVLDHGRGSRTLEDRRADSELESCPSILCFAQQKQSEHINDQSQVNETGDFPRPFRAETSRVIGLGEKLEHWEESCPSSGKIRNPSSSLASRSGTGWDHGPPPPATVDSPSTRLFQVFELSSKDRVFPGPIMEFLL